jgi:hypothetical protein
LFIDVNVDLGVKIEPLEAAFHHAPGSVGGIGGDQWVGAAEGDASRGGKVGVHRHPFMKRQGLVHRRELMEPIGAQGANCQA